MRSQKELIARFQERREDDFFGFETDMYVVYMDYNQADALVESGVFKYKPARKKWKKPEYQQDIKKKMHDYMVFAWMKANDERGFSAIRNILHYLAWIWIAGDEDLLERVEREYENYHSFGKPILEAICEYYRWDWRQWDDGRRTNG